MAKKTEEKNEFFESLKAGLEAAIEHAKGNRKHTRTHNNPSTISQGPERIARIEGRTQFF